MNDTKNWHVVVTRKANYKNAGALLEKLGYSFYIPIQKQLRYWSDRKRWIDVPVLIPYIFILTNPSGRKLLFESSNIFRFITMNGKLAIAKEQEIENLKLICSYSQGVTIRNSSIKKGDKITITHGPFTGMTGYVVKESGKQRFHIMINSLGKFASVDIDSNLLAVK